MENGQRRGDGLVVGQAAPKHGDGATATVYTVLMLVHAAGNAILLNYAVLPLLEADSLAMVSILCAEC